MPGPLADPLTGGAARVKRIRLFYVCALGGDATAIAVLTPAVGRAPDAVTLTVTVAGGCCGPVASGGLSSLVATLVPAAADRGRAYAPDEAFDTAASFAGPTVVSAAAEAASPAAATALMACAAACALLRLLATAPRPLPSPTGSR